MGIAKLVLRVERPDASGYEVEAELTEPDLRLSPQDFSNRILLPAIWAILNQVQGKTKPCGPNGEPPLHGRRTDGEETGTGTDSR